MECFQVSCIVECITAVNNFLRGVTEERIVGEMDGYRRRGGICILNPRFKFSYSKLPIRSKLKGITSRSQPKEREAIVG